MRSLSDVLFYLFRFEFTIENIIYQTCDSRKYNKLNERTKRTCASDNLCRVIYGRQ